MILSLLLMLLVLPQQQRTEAKGWARKVCRTVCHIVHGHRICNYVCSGKKKREFDAREANFDEEVGIFNINYQL